VNIILKKPNPRAHPHRLPVEWLSLEEWSLPQNEGKLTTVFPLQKYEDNLVEMKGTSIGSAGAVKPKTASTVPVIPKDGHVRQQIRKSFR